jgi:hypothetical protein
MFQLTRKKNNEPVTVCDRFSILKLQHSAALLHALTEQGVAMLSTVFNSERAIEVNFQIMKAFVRLRQRPYTHADLAKKLEALEQK